MAQKVAKLLVQNKANDHAAKEVVFFAFDVNNRRVFFLEVKVI